MKNKLLFILPIMIISMFYFVGDVDASSTILNLTTDSYTLSQGKTIQLKINGVKAKKVKWKSSNKKVATVSKNGTVKAVKSGKATISGKYKGINFKTKIIVMGKEINKLLCEDKNISVTLKEIKNGYIYISIKNKTNKDFTFGDRYLTINGETYYDDLYVDTVYANTIKTDKIYVEDEDFNSVDYNFTSGKFSGRFYYYRTDEESTIIEENDLDFNIEIK